MGYRKLEFDRVVEKLRCNHYSKICGADYSNLAVAIFDSNRFAGNLGVSVKFLYDIKLLRDGDNCGWHICLVPSHQDLIKLKDKIERGFENEKNNKTI